MKMSAVYLGRVLLTLAVALVAVGFFLASKNGVVWNDTYLIRVLSQLDIFHHLVYVWLIVAAVGLWLGFRGWSVPRIVKPVGRVLVSTLLSLALGAALILAVRLARQRVPLNNALLGAGYVAFNFLAVSIASLFSQKESKGLRVIRRLVLAADLLAPLLVWEAYRARYPKSVRWLQIAPLTMVLFLASAPWLVNPMQEFDNHYDFPSSLRRITFGDETVFCYQIEVDPTDGQLLCADNGHRVCKLDPATGAFGNCGSAQPIWDAIQGFGIDQSTREVAYFDHCSRNIFFFDETDLHRLSYSPSPSPEPDRACPPVRGGCRAQWSARAGVLIAFTFYPGLIIADREGKKNFDFGRSTEGMTADAVIDDAQRKIHLVNTKPRLLKFNVDSLAVESELVLPSLPERIALDAKRNRLFITLPILGEVLVVDARSYEPIATIGAFPGVRVVTVDAESGRLILGGFSPVIEIRSLGDFSLRNRVTGPYWMRWITVDAKRNRLFIEAADSGLWKLDLQQLQSAPGAFWQRTDPAYLFLRAAVRVARRLILLTRPHPDMFQ